MLKFIFSTRSVLFIIAFSFLQYGCRKKIDFNEGESSSETIPLDPLQQYYAPWEKVPLVVDGSAFMMESDNSYLYIVSDNGSRRNVQYLNSNHTHFPLFYSTTYQFKSIHKGVNRMILCASGGSKGITTFNNTGILTSYSFYISSSKRINAIYDDAISFYAGGNYSSYGSAPVSSNADRVISNNGSVQGCPGVISEVYDITRIDLSPYACGKAIIPSGHSIASWNGTSWDPYTSIVNEKITDLQVIGDTLFIAGFSPGDFAIRKYANGNLITDLNVINTATSTSNSMVKMLTYDGRLFVYGTVNFSGKFYEGVLEYYNGEWGYIGKLGAVPDDVAIYNYHLYALVKGVLKRYPL